MAWFRRLCRKAQSFGRALREDHFILLKTNDAPSYPSEMQLKWTRIMLSVEWSTQSAGYPLKWHFESTSMTFWGFPSGTTAVHHNTMTIIGIISQNFTLNNSLIQYENCQMFLVFWAWRVLALCLWCSTTVEMCLIPNLLINQMEFFQLITPWSIFSCDTRSSHDHF